MAFLAKLLIALGLGSLLSGLPGYISSCILAFLGLILLWKTMIKKPTRTRSKK